MVAKAPLKCPARAGDGTTKLRYAVASISFCERKQSRFAFFESRSEHRDVHRIHGGEEARCHPCWTPVRPAMRPPLDVGLQSDAR